MKLKILFLILSIGSYSFGQTVTYNDVAVIVNDNSQTSIDIGNYFQQARNIPNQNMIHVFAPITEEIDSLGFEQIRSQIEAYLINNNLVDSINYLVTTKGVPLKVESGCFETNSTYKVCASFDSELTLILGTYSDKIGLSGAWPNPVNYSTENFSRDNSGIYLVTRLDGYTKQDVFSLIDRSGPETGISQQSAQAILRLGPSNSSDTYFMNEILQPTYDYLTNNSWNAQIDSTSSPLLNQSNVFSYTFAGSAPIPNVSLNYTWTNGSIGTIATCSTAFTFDDLMNPLNNFLIADLISGGCTGAYGNVDCIYYTQVLNSELLHSRYLDPIINYNLAESFYMAEPSLSWQAVIIGDPKASVYIDDLAYIEDVSIGKISVYPNPSSGSVKVIGKAQITSISLFDMTGAEVKTFHQSMTNSVELDLQGITNGVYLLQAEIGGNLVRERLVISK